MTAFMVIDKHGAGEQAATIDERPPMTGYFQISQTMNGQLTFNLKAGNHEVILTSSRLFGSVLAARGAIEMVRRNSRVEARFVRKVSGNSSPYFVLAAEDGQILGKSEMYSSAAAMEKGIRSVMTNGSSTVFKGLNLN